MKRQTVSMPAVIYERRGAIAVVSLNRPDRLNAYNVAMRDALHETLLAIRDDPEVRAVVLRGNGPAFSTGGDLSEFGTAPSPMAARAARWGRDVWGLLKDLRQPTVAAIHGYTVGGGWEMAMLCDLCIASREARLCLPETGLGMIPGVGGTQTAARRGGWGRALDWTLSGRWVEAPEALALGIVVAVVPRPRLDAAALALALRCASIAPDLAAALKRAVWDGLDTTLERGLALEREVGARCEAEGRRMKDVE